MFVVHNLALATLFCVITMLGWGSWANTQKLAGKDKWPFPLFYWDYAIGVFLFSFVFAHTLGSFGATGQDVRTNLHQAASGPALRALFSGALFNFSNLLLVIAIDTAGMAVAFPVGVGLALVIGTVASYVEAPQGNFGMLFSGVMLVVLAIVLSAIAHSRLPRPSGGKGVGGLAYAVAAGCLMGLFYPQLAASLSPDFNSSPIEGGLLTPYAALALFAIGLLVSNFIFNTVFMRMHGVRYRDYFRGSAKLHSLGLLGGVIWMLALSLNLIASGIVGPAVSYALGQGATLVAAIWGVAVWKEFRGAPPGTGRLVVLMFACYAAGLIAIGAATL